MNIEVTRDNVTILEQSETPHENEYKITTCYFAFDEFTSSFQVKRAIFTVLSTGEMYETDIINDKCDIPVEVLKHEYETVKLGVYGYNIGEDEELLNRFSPSYAEIIVPTGSYKEGALSPEPITPSQYDLYSQALQEGLQEVDDKLDEVVETVDGKLEEVDDKLEEVDTTVDNKMTEVNNKIDEVDDKITEVDGKITEVDTAITETNNLNLEVSDKVDGDVTVTLTKKDASTKSVVISDGTSLQFMWQGTSLGIKTDDMQEYVFVDLQGIQGVPGPQGEPFRIKKTYSSVAEMNADFDNMEYGDYVMIASTVEVEDNAKLYTRGESQWIFITDFSGATGIKGETGATPNIQIGTVTSGSTPSVTRTGTNENPVLNFVLQPGEKGSKGDTGATGNGIASITKTSTSGLVDTYTITFTNGNTTTFNVTNGNGIDHISLTSQSGATKVYTIYYTDGTTSEYTVQDGEVTQEVFDEEIVRNKMVYNGLPKVSGEGTDLTLNNTAECPVYDIELSPSELSQETTTGANLQKFDARTSPTYGYTCDETGQVTITGTTSANAGLGYNLQATNPMTLEAGTYTLKVIGTIDSNVSIQTMGTVRTLNANQEYQFTLTETINDFYAGSYVRAGTHNSSYYITLAQGTTGTTERYTGGQPSPSPDYPQQIHTVSGENTIEITPNNKNKFNKNKVEYKNDYYLNNDGEEVSLSSVGYTTTFISVTPNTTYTISGDVATSVGFLRIYYYDINKNWISRTGGLGASPQTFTTLANAYYIQIQYQKSVFNINTVQLELGNQATEYTPFVYEDYPLSLGDLEYCKIGNYEDLFFKNVVGNEYYDSTLELDKWYLKKNILTTTDTIGSLSKTIDNMISDSTVYSYCGGTVSGTTITYTSALVVANYIYYPTTTPTYTLLSDTLQTQLDNIAKAISYQEQTNVSQTNADLPFVLNLSAIRDLSGIFELIQ